MSNVKCLSCGSDIVIDFQPYKGDFIECDECGMEFEIVATNPVKIDWAEYEDDDEYYDDDEY